MGSHIFLSRIPRVWLRKKPSLRLTTPFRNSYIVLLPEIPSDSPKTNVLLQTDQYTDFKSLTFMKCYNGVGKLVLEFEGELCKLEESLKDPEYSRSFQSVAEVIEKHSVPLEYAWSVVKMLYIVKNTFMKSDKYFLLHDRARKARVQKYTCLPIFYALKEVLASGDVLTDVQKRVIEKYLVEGKLNGIELTGNSRKALDACIRQIEEKKKKFQENLEIGTKRFKHVITDFSLVKDIPSQILNYMAENRNFPDKAPWVVTLAPDVYNAFLEYCPDRIQRWNTWRAHRMRASTEQDTTINNVVVIEDIRKLRKEQAKYLGYDSYVDMSMETKMAGSLKNVKSVINTLLSGARSDVEKEVDSLQEFASSRGFRSKLEEWDVPYWRRKQRQTLFNVDTSLVREYFPYEIVLKKMFSLCEDLFGCRIVRNDKVTTWHKDVEVYRVLDWRGEEISGFYIDPYLRPQEKIRYSANDSWMVALRNRSVVAGTTPLCALVFNFSPPLASLPCLLHFREVQELFEKFGLCLQHIMTNSPYSEVSGATNIEWDSVKVLPKFMKFWLHQPQTMEEISSHYQHENSMPADLITSIACTQQHMAAYDLCRELYLSHLDLDLHSRSEHCMEIVKDLWSYYFPFDLQKRDLHVCGFHEVFSGDWGGAYYSNIWSNMVAADLFNAFLEVGFDSEEVKKVGKRFRKTYLNLGGSAKPNEIFRKFRGRDPCPIALLKLFGLSQG